LRLKYKARLHIHMLEIFFYHPMMQMWRSYNNMDKSLVRKLHYSHLHMSQLESWQFHASTHATPQSVLLEGSDGHHGRVLSLQGEGASQYNTIITMRMSLLFSHNGLHLLTSYFTKNCSNVLLSCSLYLESASTPKMVVPHVALNLTSYSHHHHHNPEAELPPPNPKYLTPGT
jgi:hypothetical protein